MSPLHLSQTLEVEADSLAEARHQLQIQMPQGFLVLSERIISDGEPKTIQGIGETMERAHLDAQQKVPADAEILEEKEVTIPNRKVIEVVARNEQEAENSASWQAKLQFNGDAVVERIRLVTKGSKGLLGFGEKPNQYEAELIQKAVVSITYKTKAKVSAQVGNKQTEYQQAFIRTLTEYRQQSSSGFPVRLDRGGIELQVLGTYGNKENCKYYLKLRDSSVSGGKIERQIEQEVDIKDIEQLKQELELLTGRKIKWEWVNTSGWMDDNTICYVARL